MAGLVKSPWPPVFWTCSPQVYGIFSNCTEGLRSRSSKFLMHPVLLYGWEIWTMNDLKRWSDAFGCMCQQNHGKLLEWFCVKSAIIPWGWIGAHYLNKWVPAKAILACSTLSRSQPCSPGCLYKTKPLSRLIDPARSTYLRWEVGLHEDLLKGIPGGSMVLWVKCHDPLLINWLILPIPCSHLNGTNSFILPLHASHQVLSSCSHHLTQLSFHSFSQHVCPHRPHHTFPPPTQTCPVRGVVVITEDAQFLPLPNSHLSHEGHEVVGAPQRVLPNEAWRVCTNGVEVPKQHQPPLLQDKGKIKIWNINAVTTSCVTTVILLYTSHIAGTIISSTPKWHCFSSIIIFQSSSIPLLTV